MVVVKHDPRAFKVRSPEGHSIRFREYFATDYVVIPSNYEFNFIPARRNDLPRLSFSLCDSIAVVWSYFYRGAPLRIRASKMIPYLQKRKIRCFATPYSTKRTFVIVIREIKTDLFHSYIMAERIVEDILKSVFVRRDKSTQKGRGSSDPDNYETCQFQSSSIHFTPPFRSSPIKFSSLHPQSEFKKNNEFPHVNYIKRVLIETLSPKAASKSNTNISILPVNESSVVEGEMLMHNLPEYNKVYEEKLQEDKVDSSVLRAFDPYPKICSVGQKTPFVERKDYNVDLKFQFDNLEISNFPELSTKNTSLPMIPEHPDADLKCTDESLAGDGLSFEIVPNKEKNPEGDECTISSQENVFERDENFSIESIKISQSLVYDGDLNENKLLTMVDSNEISAIKNNNEIPAEQEFSSQESVLDCLYSQNELGSVPALVKYKTEDNLVQLEEVNTESNTFNKARQSDANQMLCINKKDNGEGSSGDEFNNLFLPNAEFKDNIEESSVNTFNKLIPTENNQRTIYPHLSINKEDMTDQDHSNDIDHYSKDTTRTNLLSSIDVEPKEYECIKRVDNETEAKTDLLNERSRSCDGSVPLEENYEFPEKIKALLAGPKRHYSLSFCNRETANYSENDIQNLIASYENPKGPKMHTKGTYVCKARNRKRSRQIAQLIVDFDSLHLVFWASESKYEEKIPRSDKLKYGVKSEHVAKTYLLPTEALACIFEKINCLTKKHCIKIKVDLRRSFNDLNWKIHKFYFPSFGCSLYNGAIFQITDMIRFDGRSQFVLKTPDSAQETCWVDKHDAIEIVSFDGINFVEDTKGLLENPGSPTRACVSQNGANQWRIISFIYEFQSPIQSFKSNHYVKLMHGISSEKTSPEEFLLVILQILDNCAKKYDQEDVICSILSEFLNFINVPACAHEDMLNNFISARGQITAEAEIDQI